MKRILSILTTLALLAMLTASAAWADPPRPRRTYAYRTTWCIVDGGGYTFIIRPYVNMLYQGTSASGYWYRVIWPNDNVPLLCPASQLRRPTTGR